MIFQLLASFGWLIPFVVLGACLKSPFIKGALGEFQVNLAAKRSLDKGIYTLFKNVTLRTEDGTTQIDHVIVSRFGVFVIETKNMTGWIFGGKHQKTWTQQIYRHKTKFQNPLHQNYKHKITLQDTFGLDPEKVFSLVVFVRDRTFKTDMPENVVYTGGYIRFIKNKQQVVFNDNEVQEICANIQMGRLKPSIKTHIDHVKHVQKIVVKKSNQADDSCPMCGNPMVLRTARSGHNQGKQFLGCSAYPKCRVVKQAA